MIAQVRTGAGRSHRCRQLLARAESTCSMPPPPRVTTGTPSWHQRQRTAQPAVETYNLRWPCRQWRWDPRSAETDRSSHGQCTATASGSHGTATQWTFGQAAATTSEIAIDFQEYKSRADEAPSQRWDKLVQRSIANALNKTS